jgi:hypothetical protein
LTKLDGAFKGLVAAGGQVDISTNSGLISADGAFPSLVNTGGKVLIRSNNNVGFTSLTSAFPKLKSTPGLEIFNNNHLTGPGTSFGALASVGADGVNIESNVGLTSAGMDGAFPALLTSAGKVRIHNNGNEGFTSLISAFPLLKSADSLEISNNDHLTSTASSFNQLAALTGASVALRIYSNEKLEDVPAFANQLVYSGNRIYLYNNFLLTSLTGWDNIKCIHPDGCELNWAYNNVLTKDDVCNAWDGMAGQEGGRKPKKHNSGCAEGNRPCYGGTSGNNGLAANC